MSDEVGAHAPVRIDKWLWVARLAKTRPIAAEAVKGGHVEVNGRRVPPGRGVGPGDRIELTIGGIPRVVIVRGTAERRGPASVAATLYEETPDSVAERERISEQRRLAARLDPFGGLPGAPGGPRPTKRERRRLDAERRGRRG